MCLCKLQFICSPCFIITIITSVCRHPLGKLISNNMQILPFARIINSCYIITTSTTSILIIISSISSCQRQQAANPTSWDVNMCPDSLGVAFISFHPRRRSQQKQHVSICGKRALRSQSIRCQDRMSDLLCFM